MNCIAALSASAARTPPSARWTLAVLAAVAVAARVLNFGNPVIFVDEEFYYVVARAIANGALPYVDVWDRKPIGLFLLYLPAGLFAPPIGIWTYQLLASAFVIGTAWLVCRIAILAGWQGGALVAAVLYILWLNLADGQGGQAPVFYNFPMAGAAALTLSATGQTDPGARFRRGLAAMAVTGVAMQIKYTAVFEGVWFGLWLLGLERRARTPLPQLLSRALALAGVAALPTMLAIAVYAALGHLDAFLFANFQSILARRADPPRESLDNLLTAVLILTPLLAIALAGLRGSGASTLQSRFVRSWLIAALGGFLVFGSWFNHYTLPVMVPAACCAAALFGRARWSLRLGWAVALLAFGAGQYVMLGLRTARGTPAEFGRIAATVGRGSGALYVYSGSTMLYATSDRPVLTRYVFPTHLMLARESGAIGADQGVEINRILDHRPEVVVVQDADRDESPVIRKMLMTRLARDGYRPVATLPYGRYANTIYRTASR